jgi:hypothetical protein
MKKLKRMSAWAALAVIALPLLAQQEMTVVKPHETQEVLNNPGIGFTTFQRFNGDKLNLGEDWTEGFPLDYQPTPSTDRDPGYPATTLAYFRLYWRFLEPKKDEYDWSQIDKALITAHKRGQTLILRLAPNGSATNVKGDVPDWYREETGEQPAKVKQASSWKGTTGKWVVDPENPAYAREFGAMVRALAARYDGDPRLELVDISIVGAWGESAGSELLSEPTRRALVDSYMESFHKTPLVTQLADERTARDILAQARNGGAAAYPNAPVVGWRADCLGDMGGFSPTTNHMEDKYPEELVERNLNDAWKQAPVAMEACWVMQHWEAKHWDVQYIMDQALKWHVSSFNNKSTAIPVDLWPKVNEWLKHMGYRFALRRFAYTAQLDSRRRIDFESWWENKGDAPIYRPYEVALRIWDDHSSVVLPLEGDLRKWLPGDSVLNGFVFVPTDLPAGDYHLAIGVVDPTTRRPAVKLAIEGRDTKGWYPMGTLHLSSIQQ